MTLYRKPTDREMETSLKRLLDSMDRNAPIEIVLRDIEDVQMFLLAHSDGEKNVGDPTH